MESQEKCAFGALKTCLGPATSVYRGRYTLAHAAVQEGRHFSEMHVCEARF